jgi:AcrR family transcriptional regulator
MDETAPGQSSVPADPNKSLEAAARQRRAPSAGAARGKRAAAAGSRVLGAATRAAIRQAVAEAREALKETGVEVRIERLSREESRQRTRDRLLDAAAEVFARLGYHGASLEAVADAAGFTKGAVYSNFATKGELFAALLLRSSSQHVAAQIEAMQAITLGQLADMAGPMLKQQALEHATWDILQIEFWLAAIRDPTLLGLLREGTEDLYRELGQQLEAQLAAAGVTARFDGVELARLINAVGSGLLLQVYLDPESVDPALFGRAIRALAGLPAVG